MKTLDTDRVVHFVGIGGYGMSAIALVLLEKGVRVRGSDLKESRNTRRLREMGGEIHIGHRPEHVEGADLVVVSSAVPERNPEVRRARELGIEVLPRAEMLGRLMREGKGIAVAGTHGKTTTTSMLAMIFRGAGLDPTYIVGGELNDVGSNAYAGRGEYVIAEADESDGSFLYLSPWAAAVINVELDHHDFYPDRLTMLEYFGRFVELVPAEGVVALSGDDPGALSLVERGKARKILFGAGKECDLRYGDVRLSRGGGTFTVWRKGKKLGKVELHVPGLHNVRNAAAALALSLEAGVDFEDAAAALHSFKGVMRRYQFVDEVRGIRLVDDYAHHPTEVRVTLETARGEGRRVVCIFQPHRYSRTAALWREFGKELAKADAVILTDVYSAGETPLPGVNGKLILNALLEEKPFMNAVYLPQRGGLEEGAMRFLEEGDLVLTMGAGDISQSAEEIARLLRAAGEEAEGCREGKR